jgi:transaldolase
MPKTSVQELYEFGQSIWLDNISRAMIESGKLEQMIGLGLRGLTSNPTIFNKAISESSDYNEKIIQLRNEGKSTFEIYDELTVKDVQDAADIFFAVFQKSNGLDGFVSLEINPKLAYKPEETIKEGKRLFLRVNRPNVMLKVPATQEGLLAIEELVACGININATLIFFLEQYVNTANAYIRGIRRFLQSKGEVSRVRSVASVFVSRIDTYIDKRLTELQNSGLAGKAAASNCAAIYRKFSEIFCAPEFCKLKESGVNSQRVLWGSTSTKNPDYSDIKYVAELVAKNTVNTMPEETFYAFLEHGKVQEALTYDNSCAQKTIEALQHLGVDINDVCSQLLKAGVAAFEQSFDSLIATLERKKNLACAI